MKITFFKNEKHFCRVSAMLHPNIIEIRPRLIARLLKYPLLIAAQLPLAAYVILRWESFASNWWYAAVIYFVLVPVHEFFHALHCWLTKRKVKRFCFFPYNFGLSFTTAYVEPDASVYKRGEAVLLALFPLIWITVLGSILAVWMPAWRAFWVFFVIGNFSASCMDLYDTLVALTMPRTARLFSGSVGWGLPRLCETSFIYLQELPAKSDRIEYRQWRYKYGQLTEIIPPEIDKCALRMEQYIREKSNLPSAHL